MIEKIVVIESLLGSYERARMPQVATDLEEELKRLKKNYNSSTYQYYKIRYDQLKNETN
jgi:hypothetical protein